MFVKVNVSSSRQKLLSLIPIEETYKISGEDVFFEFLKYKCIIKLRDFIENNKESIKRVFVLDDNAAVTHLNLSDGFDVLVDELSSDGCEFDNHRDLLDSSLDNKYCNGLVLNDEVFDCRQDLDLQDSIKRVNRVIANLSNSSSIEDIKFCLEDLDKEFSKIMNEYEMEIVDYLDKNSIVELMIAYNRLEKIVKTIKNSKDFANPTIEQYIYKNNYADVFEKILLVNEILKGVFNDLDVIFDNYIQFDFLREEKEVVVLDASDIFAGDIMNSELDEDMKQQMLDFLED